MSEPPTNDGTLLHPEVKDQIIPGTPNSPLTKLVITARLQGHLKAALEDYARKRALSPKQALVEILEQRLVETKDLPGWWFERAGTLK